MSITGHDTSKTARYPEKAGCSHEGSRTTSAEGIDNRNAVAAAERGRGPWRRVRPRSGPIKSRRCAAPCTVAVSPCRARRLRRNSCRRSCQAELRSACAS